MRSLYKISVILSLLIIFITTIINNKKCKSKDNLILIFMKIYFSMIPILNIIISIGMIYVYIDDIIQHKRDIIKKGI